MAREIIHSGIEWIGEIPKGWKIRKLKNMCKRITDGSHFSPERQTDGYPYITVSNVYDGNIHLEEALRIKKEDFDLLVANGCKPENGDVLLSKDGTVGRTAVVQDVNYVVLSSLGILTPASDCKSQYLKYLLDSDSLQRQMQLAMAGSALRRITIIKINELVGILPPLSEQQKIANYLDKVCGEVDEMIALQEQMIEELKAYKQSVISEAVTKGLNPNVPMKDSGIDWIGEIPEHWKAEKLKYLISKIESGVSVNAGNVPAKESEIGVLKTSCVSKYIFDVNENKTVYSNEIDRVACPVRANTIIVSRMNTPELVGACGYVSDDCDNIYLPDRLWQVHFYDDVCVKYIWFVMRSSFIRNYYSSLSVGSSSSMQNISQDQFANAIIVLPPLNEQQSIASYLDTKCAEIDALIAIKQAKIEELKEYKKSIIYEYVTGKKEVV